MTRPHHILYLTSTSLTPCTVVRGQMKIEPSCPPTAEGFARFEAFLQANPPGSRMTILADLADEAHHLESLPFARGRDRRNMLERRRQHLFGDTPFVLTRSLGRSPEGRRDEQVLFAALPRPAVITPWLERIVQAGHVPGGITSVPFLTRHLVPADISGPMVLAHATPAGFRVSCFEKGQPRFSRLTALAAAPGQSGNTWQDELRRSADYLLNQRILPRDPPTPVLLILTPELGLSPDANLSSLHPGLAIRIETSPTGAAAQPGSPLHGLLEILSRHPGEPQFAPHAILARRRHLIFAQAAWVLAAAGILACAGVSLHDLGSIRDLRQQKETNLARSRALEAQASALRGTLHTAPHPLPQLEQLELDLANLEALQQAPQGPETDLRRLADILSGNPAIQIEALDWRRLPPVGENSASRSLEIKIAPPPQELQAGVAPPPLMSLLRALRQWPETEVRQTSGTLAPESPAPRAGDVATDDRAAPDDHPSIQVRWLPRQ